MHTKRRWIAGAVVTGAATLLVGIGPASAGGGEEITMTGTPGVGKTVTLSGEGCAKIEPGSGDASPAAVNIFLREISGAESGKLVSVGTGGTAADGEWTFRYFIPTDAEDGSPVEEGKQYGFQARCVRPPGEFPSFNYARLDFTMGAAAAPGPEPSPEPAPEPSPEPEPEPAPPPTVLGNQATQPPAPVAAPAAPVAAPRALAFTGDGTETLAAAGGAFLALGTAVLLLARRTRRVEIT